MEKLKILLVMLLGVISLQLYSKPKYRIETWVARGEHLYQPQKKVWLRINYIGRLPIKIWQSGQYPLKTQIEAEQIILNWEQDNLEKNLYKHSQYITIN
jgi:hypothetical protein